MFLSTLVQSGGCDKQSAKHKKKAGCTATLMSFHKRHVDYVSPSCCSYVAVVVLWLALFVQPPHQQDRTLHVGCFFDAFGVSSAWSSSACMSLSVSVNVSHHELLHRGCHLLCRLQPIIEKGTLTVSWVGVTVCEENFFVHCRRPTL